jgi:hypothetical protein
MTCTGPAKVTLDLRLEMGVQILKTKDRRQRGHEPALAELHQVLPTLHPDAARQVQNPLFVEPGDGPEVKPVQFLLRWEPRTNDAPLWQRRAQNKDTLRSTPFSMNHASPQSTCISSPGSNPSGKKTSPLVAFQCRTYRLTAL